jgi:hypothetical protein
VFSEKTHVQFNKISTAVMLQKFLPFGEILRRRKKLQRFIVRSIETYQGNGVLKQAKGP